MDPEIHFGLKIGQFLALFPILHIPELIKFNFESFKWHLHISYTFIAILRPTPTPSGPGWSWIHFQTPPFDWRWAIFTHKLTGSANNIPQLFVSVRHWMFLGNFPHQFNGLCPWRTNTHTTSPFYSSSSPSSRASTSTLSGGWPRRRVCWFTSLSAIPFLP